MGMGKLKNEVFGMNCGALGPKQEKIFPYRSVNTAWDECAYATVHDLDGTSST